MTSEGVRASNKMICPLTYFLPLPNMREQAETVSEVSGEGIPRYPFVCQRFVRNTAANSTTVKPPPQAARIAGALQCSEIDVGSSSLRFLPWRSRCGAQAKEYFLRLEC